MAAGAIVILPGLDQKAIIKLRRTLENPNRILKQLGMVVLGDAQKAFKEQKLGDILWPARYPRQRPPYINIAGVVGDFLAGRKNPPGRRFQNRPAGIDTGVTMRGMTPSRALTVNGYVVKIKSPSPKAASMQFGGRSTQRITKAVKDSLAEWMKKERRKFKRAKKASGYLTFDRYRSNKVPKGALRRMAGGKPYRIQYHDAKVQQAAERLSAVQRLGFLFRRKRLVTRIGKRPFLGITDEGKRKMLRIVSGEFLPPGIRGRVKP